MWIAGAYTRVVGREAITYARISGGLQRAASSRWPWSSMLRVSQVLGLYQAVVNRLHG